MYVLNLNQVSHVMSDAVCSKILSNKKLQKHPHPFCHISWNFVPSKAKVVSEAFWSIIGGGASALVEITTRPFDSSEISRISTEKTASLVDYSTFPSPRKS